MYHFCLVLVLVCLTVCCTTVSAAYLVPFHRTFGFAERDCRQCREEVPPEAEFARGEADFAKR